jgi:glycosidase
MPQLYAGDEIAMKGGDDPENRRDFPGGFPGGTHDAFSVSGRTPEEQAEFAWVSSLTRLRREHPALACGGEQVLAANQAWLVTLRDGSRAAEGCAVAGPTGRSERVLVALHRGAGAQTLDVQTANTWAEGCHVSQPILGGGSVKTEGVEHVQFSVQGNGVVIATCE